MIDIQTLGNLCSKVEGLVPGSVAGLTISNPGYTHIERALFPTLPYSFSAAITHVPLEPADFGSCVKAISVGRPITCPDSDRLFDPRWRQVCLDHGLRAIQSRPIFVDGKPSRVQRAQVRVRLGRGSDDVCSRCRKQRPVQR
jgi:hypothetical protein